MANLKSPDDPTLVWEMPNQNERIRVYSIGSVTVPDEGVLGSVVSVDYNGGTFRFLPDEPDPTRNKSDLDARRHAGDLGWFVNGATSGWQRLDYEIDEEP